MNPFSGFFSPKKLIYKGLATAMIPLFLIFVVFIGAVGAITNLSAQAAAVTTPTSVFGSGVGEYTGTNQNVLRYKSMVTELAGKYGMQDFVGLILAVMDQESGGQGLDPMQASEGGFNTRYPHSPGAIQDPAYSIECGIQELKQVLQYAASADGKTYSPNGPLPSPADINKISLALQGYNFGPGWFSYANGTYSQEKAQAFSTMMANKMGWRRYGDPLYVPHVLEHYAATETSASTNVLWPVPGHTNITSGFGSRWGTTHKGLDISDGSVNGAPIVAATDGVVIQASFGVAGSGYGGYGNCVAIDNGNGVITLYAHMSRIACARGQTVTAGTLIGYVGTTGDSTGPHLHFEIRLNGTAVDPLPYLQGEKQLPAAAQAA